jgi:hypothetical protein
MDAFTLLVEPASAQGGSIAEQLPPDPVCDSSHQPGVVAGLWIADVQPYSRRLGGGVIQDNIARDKVHVFIVDQDSETLQKAAQAGAGVARQRLRTLRKVGKHEYLMVWYQGNFPRQVDGESIALPCGLVWAERVARERRSRGSWLDVGAAWIRQHIVSVGRFCKQGVGLGRPETALPSQPPPAYAATGGHDRSSGGIAPVGDINAKL